jgi:hypothetical protein
VTVPVYVDHNVRADIVGGLRDRNIDCLTAAEDGRATVDDDVLLARASELNRVMLSMDEDMLAIATSWMRSGRAFSGLIYAHQLGVTIGGVVIDVELLATHSNPEDLNNMITYLPL